MNVVDILSILPFFIELFMNEDTIAEVDKILVKDEVSDASGTPTWWSNSTIKVEEGEDEEDDSFKGLVQVFRVFKLARILKLAR